MGPKNTAPLIVHLTRELVLNRLEGSSEDVTTKCMKSCSETLDSFLWNLLLQPNMSDYFIFAAHPSQSFTSVYSSIYLFLCQPSIYLYIHLYICLYIYLCLYLYIYQYICLYVGACIVSLSASYLFVVISQLISLLLFLIFFPLW